MPNNVLIRLGATVRSKDGPRGTVLRVVIDPTDQRLTHLAVGSKHGDGRLVPVDLVSEVKEQVQLTCTTAEFDGCLSDQDGTASPRFAEPDMSRQTGMLTFTYLASQIPGPIGHEAQIGAAKPAGMTTFDRVPAGEEELKPTQNVTATDGPVGRVAGLSIAVPTGIITGLLVESGHLWAKKETVVPIKAVAHFGISVRLAMTKEQMGRLSES